MTSATQTRIAVTVATRGRPRSCARLLESLFSQEITPGQQIHVIVVDNTVSGSALQQLPRDERLTVVHERRTGIPFARNRGVHLALGWADVIVFVDDDEVPADEQWLGALVGTLTAEDVEMATGPVQARFHGGSPSWIRTHPIFQNKQRPARQALSEAYTSNLAVRTDVFRNLNRWFDERLRHCGGSDTEFTRRAVRDGATIAWVKDAVVLEDVAPRRTTMRWILRRSARLGANRTQRLRLTEVSVWQWAFLALGAAAEVGLGGVVALLTPIIGRRNGLIALGRATRGVGTLLAMLGLLQAEEYRHVDTQEGDVPAASAGSVEAAPDLDRSSAPQ